MLISAASFAQQGKMTVGIHGAYIIDSPHNFGLGANIGYEFIDNLRGVAEFDYYFKKDYVSFWEVDANVEYLFRLSGGKVALYPLIGLNVLGQSVGDTQTVSDSKLGMNIGAGVEIPVSSSIALKAEYNYKTQGNGASFLKFGVVIPF